MDAEQKEESETEGRGTYDENRDGKYPKRSTGLILLEPGAVAAAFFCVTSRVVCPTKGGGTARIGTIIWLVTGVCRLVFANIPGGCGGVATTWVLA